MLQIEKENKESLRLSQYFSLVLLIPVL